MAALLRHGLARRIGDSLLQRTQATLTSPVVAEERRRLVPRRMYRTEERAPQTRQEYLHQKFGHLKRHQICWLFIKIFPFGKLFGLVAMTYVAVTFVSVTRELKQEEEAEKKMREQSASREFKRER